VNHKPAYIIILNWNGLKDTMDCVESCRELLFPEFKIVVVDNGSTDGSETILRAELKDVTVVQTGANLGFAGGNNVGIRYALGEGAEYIWLLNNDTVVDSDALSALIDVAASDDSIGVLGSKTFFYDNPDRLNTAGGSINWKTGQPSLIGYGEKDDGRFDKIREVDTVSGCSLFIKREVIEDIGLMDERFFLYFEETDWVVRAHRAGYKVVYVPGSKIWHKVSAAVGGHESPLMKYYMTRNNLLFMKNNADEKTYRHFLLNYLLNLMPRELMRMLFKNKNKRVLKAKAMLLGLLHYFSGRFGQFSVSSEG
jgi:GT2 family glycosyltransferase